MHVALALPTLLSLALIPLAASASPGTTDAWRQIEAFDRQREREELERRQRQLVGDAPAAPDEAAPAARCEPVAGLAIGGNRLLGSTQLQRAARPSMASCMTPQAINHVLSAITAAYVEAGYIMARPYRLPPRAMGEPLRVWVLEGKVQSVEVQDPSLPLSLSNALGELPGQPLHLPTLERGMDQLNRLRVLDLASDLLPGDAPGDTRVRLRPLSYPPRAWPSLLLDNRGSLSTGRERAMLTFNLDSPLLLNDALLVGLQRSLPNGANFNRSYFTTYSLARGPWQLSFNTASFDYRSQFKARYSRLTTQGRGSVYGLALERQLWRNSSTLLSTTLRATHKATTTRLNGITLASQSPAYRTLGLQLDALWRHDGNWNAQLLYSQGLGGWRADDEFRWRQANAQSARFGLWRAGLGHAHGSALLGRPWLLSSQLTGQYTRHRLPVLDQLNLPGDYSLRGFRDLAASFDRGGYWQNTLSTPLPGRLGVTSSARLGMDMAIGDGRQARRGERLAGSSLGLNLRHGEVAVDLEYQHPLYRRSGALPPGYWQLQLQARF